MLSKSSNHSKFVVVAGHICLDIIPNLGHLPPGQFETMFHPGRLIEAGAARFSTGGPVSNTGLALHQLGIPSRLMAKVGCDPFGEIVQSVVRDCDPQLAAGISQESQAVTSYSIIISPPEQDRIFLHCPGANDTFDIHDMDFDLISQAALLHFGYPPIMRQMYINNGDGLADLLGKAKQTGVTVSLDMAFPDPSSESGKSDWTEILARALPSIDIFLPSVEELLFVLRRSMYEKLDREKGVLESLTPALLYDLSAQVLDMGAKIVVLKLGHRGLYLRSAVASAWSGPGRALPSDCADWCGRELWSPCFQVKVVGTTGSGDASIAGFLSAVLRGFPIEKALQMATAVGACNVEAADALSGLLSWEDTLSRISDGWLRCPMDIPAAGWQWDDVHSIWKGPTDTT